MLDPDELRNLVAAGLPGAHIEVEDLTGTADHYRLLVVSELFRGLPPLARHRLVYRALEGQLGGPVHALALRTLTPDAWQQEPAGSPGVGDA